MEDFSIDRDQLGTPQLHAANPSLGPVKRRKVQMEEIVERHGRMVVQPLAGLLLHLLVIRQLGTRMRVAATWMPPQVTVEIWTDVPQFVENGCQFVTKTQVQEAGQAERQEVQVFVSERTKHSLDGIPLAADTSVQRPAPEPHR